MGLQRILKMTDDNTSLQMFQDEIGANEALDFYDYAKCALYIQNGIFIDRPSWAKKKDLSASQRTFIPKISSQSLQTILSFIDGHTTANIESIIANKQIPKQLKSTNPELQS